MNCLFRHSALKRSALAIFALLLCSAFNPSASQQRQNKTTATAPPVLIKRTATRHETRRFGYGGTLTVVGPPQGSITIEGWNKSEIEVTAEIQWQAETEADLDLIAAINNFAFDDAGNHFSILTTGSHDKAYLKKVAKNFPKRLLGLPWKIDYRIRVPLITDLEINGGRGPITLSGVEGAVVLSATESDATLTLTGGVVSATIATGKVKLTIPTRSWHGGGADVRLASGELTVELAPGFSGDIDADILRLGQIEITYPDLSPRERGSLTGRSIRARAGAGGATFTFTVGDGTLRIIKK